MFYSGNKKVTTPKNRDLHHLVGVMGLRLEFWVQAESLVHGVRPQAAHGHAGRLSACPHSCRRSRASGDERSSLASARSWHVLWEAQHGQETRWRRSQKPLLRS